MIYKMEQNLQLSISQLCGLCRRESLFILLAQAAITECMEKGDLLNKMVLLGRRKGSCQSYALWSFVLIFCNHNSPSSNMGEQGQMSTRKIVTNENFITLERGNKMFVTFSSAASTEKKYRRQLQKTLFWSDLYSHYTLIISKDTSKSLFIRLSRFCCCDLFDPSNFCIFAVAQCVSLQRGNSCCRLCYAHQLLPLGKLLKMFSALRIAKNNSYLEKGKKQ